MLEFLSALLAREHYDLILTLLPTPQTHGHHRAAAELAREAIRRLPEPDRPVLLGAETRSRGQEPPDFQGEPPVLVFDRTVPFGYHRTLTYQIVSNWVIAEHKSQGLFQMDTGKHQFEDFWVLETGAGASQIVGLRSILTAAGTPTVREIVPSSF